MQWINFKALVIVLLFGCMRTHAIRVNHITKSPQSITRACIALQEAIEQNHSEPAYAIAYKLAKLGCWDALSPYMDSLSGFLSEDNVSKICALGEKGQCQSESFVSEKIKQTQVSIAVGEKNKASEHNVSKQFQNSYDAIFAQWTLLQQHQTEELELRAAHIVKLEEQLTTAAKRTEQLEATLELMKTCMVDADELNVVQTELVASQQRMQEMEGALKAENDGLQKQLKKTRAVLQDTRKQLEVAAARPQMILDELAEAQAGTIQLWEQLANLNKESEQLCLELYESKSETYACMDANNELQDALAIVQEQSEQQHVMYKDIQDKLAYARASHMSLEQEFEEYRAHNNPENFQLFIGNMKRVARDKVTKLCAVVDELNKQKSSAAEQFEQERAELIAECEAYEHHIEKLCNNMEQEREEVAEKYDALERQCELLASNNEELQQTCYQLQDVVQDHANVRQNLEVMLADVQSQLVRAQKDVQLQKDDWNILCNKFEDCREENMALAELCEKEQAHGMQQASRIIELSEMLKSTEQKSKQLISRYKSLVSAHHDLQATVEEQEGDREALLVALAELQTDFEREKRVHQDMCNDYTALCEQLNECKQENMTLVQLHQQEQAKNEHNNGWIANLSDQLLYAQEKAFALTQDLSTHHHETEQLHAELAESTQKYEMMEHQCKKLIAEVERQQQHAEQKDNQRCQYIAELEASLHQQTCVADNFSHELTITREQLAQTAHQLEEQTHASNVLTEELCYIQEMKKEEEEYAHDRIASLTIELEHEKQGRERIHENYEKAVAQVATLEGQLQESTKAYRTAMDKNYCLAIEAKEGVSRTMHIAKNKVRTLQQQYQELHKELEQAQRSQTQLKQKISDKDDYSMQLARDLECSHKHIHKLEEQLAAYIDTIRTTEMQFSAAQTVVNEPEREAKMQSQQEAEATAAA